MYTGPTASDFFFFNDTAPTEIYTLSLHDALPISTDRNSHRSCGTGDFGVHGDCDSLHIDFALDRKSTRLNSSHANISYAVFCLKKKNNQDHAPAGELPRGLYEFASPTSDAQASG